MGSWAGAGSYGMHRSRAGAGSCSTHGSWVGQVVQHAKRSGWLARKMVICRCTHGSRWEHRKSPCQYGLKVFWIWIGFWGWPGRQPLDWKFWGGMWPQILSLRGYPSFLSFYWSFVVIVDPSRTFEGACGPRFLVWGGIHLFSFYFVGIISVDPPTLKGVCWNFGVRLAWRVNAAFGNGFILVYSSYFCSYPPLVCNPPPPRTCLPTFGAWFSTPTEQNNLMCN